MSLYSDVRLSQSNIIEEIRKLLMIFLHDSDNIDDTDESDESDVSFNSDGEDKSKFAKEVKYIYYNEEDVGYLYQSLKCITCLYSFDPKWNYILCNQYFKFSCPCMHKNTRWRQYFSFELEELHECADNKFDTLNALLDHCKSLMVYKSIHSVSRFYVREVCMNHLVFYLYLKMSFWGYKDVNVQLMKYLLKICFPNK